MRGPEALPVPTSPAVIVERRGLDALFTALQSRGYDIVGPTRRDGAIVYDRLRSLDDLPAGWTDEQAPARYRLARTADDALFSGGVGPHAWKRFLHPPVLRLLAATRSNGGFACEESDDAPRYAFLGVRACDAAAIALQDQVFLQGPFVDPHYQRRRAAAFIVAVSCTSPGGTCFCDSMRTGPRVSAPHDLALTELEGDGRHLFVVSVGSERGREVLDDVPSRDATAAEVAEADGRVAAAARRMGRRLETAGLKEAILRNQEHPHWEDVAARCLTCGNCTMACPTCFCTSVDDSLGLAGDRAERWRRWDTCFAVDFSYIYGGSVRLSPRSRYRQWLTHKLATWIDQFGVAGCVGCGRCITWCPVGIDITAEAAAIRDAGAGGAGRGSSDELTRSVGAGPRR